MKVHPVADLFPMLADDELKELAEDIKQRGLLQPIVVDEDGVVLDGRNRLAACKLAGVQPTFQQYDGGDPDGYALAVNVTRRHLSKGQKAMVAVEARFLKNENTTAQGLALDAGEVSSGYIGQALMVHKFAPDLVPLVISGALPLNEAYASARERKRSAAEKARKRERINREAPDLSARVDDEKDKLTLDEAVTLLDGRQTEEKRRAQEQEKIDREHAARVSESLRGLVSYGAEGLSGAGLREEYARIYRDDLGSGAPFPVNEETIRLAGESLLALAEIWKEHRP